jgi:hypothetical protein
MMSQSIHCPSHPSNPLTVHQAFFSPSIAKPRFCFVAWAKSERGLTLKEVLAFANLRIFMASYDLLAGILASVGAQLGSAWRLN